MRMQLRPLAPVVLLTALLTPALVHADQAFDTTFERLPSIFR